MSKKPIQQRKKPTLNQSAMPKQKPQPANGTAVGLTWQQAPAGELPAHSTARPLRQQALLQMQRRQGNSAAQRLIKPVRSPQKILQPRSSIATPYLQLDNGEDSHPTLAYFAFNDVVAAGGRTDARRFRMAAYATRGRRLVNNSHGKLMHLLANYRTAYGRYENSINDARASAQTQELIQGVVIGAAASLLVAALLPLVLPEAAAAATFSGTWWLVQGGSAVAGSGLGTAAASAMDVTGSDLQPGGLAPSALESNIWRTLNNLNSGINRVTRRSYELYMLNGATAYLQAEIRRHVEGGDPDLDEQTTLDYVQDILAADQTFGQLDRTLARYTTQLDRAETQVNEMSLDDTENTTTLEQDIWIMWMREIPNDDSDILDRNPIENRLHAIRVLGPSSRLDVDFGSWTSEADELAALRAARSEARRLERQYRGSR